MPMKPYQVRCSGDSCQKTARFKIASRWSDGILSELKTYAITCEDCLARQWQESLPRREKCRTIPGETLEPPGIFELAAGKVSQDLVRRVDLEKAQTSAG